MSKRSRATNNFLKKDTINLNTKFFRHETFHILTSLMKTKHSCKTVYFIFWLFIIRNQYLSLIKLFCVFCSKHQILCQVLFIIHNLFYYGYLFTCIFLIFININGSYVWMWAEIYFFYGITWNKDKKIIDYLEIFLIGLPIQTKAYGNLHPI